MHRCQVACGWFEIIMNAANVTQFGFRGSIKVRRRWGKNMGEPEPSNAGSCKVVAQL